MGNAENCRAENGSNPRADSDRNLLRSGPARSGPLPVRPSSLYAPRPHPALQGDCQSGGRPSHVLSTSHPLGPEPWFGTAFSPTTPPPGEGGPAGRLGEGGRPDPPTPASRARLIGSSQRVFLILETLALCDHRTAPDGPRAQIDHNRPFLNAVPNNKRHTDRLFC